MTEKDKQLLLKDLCARLPYGVTMNVTEPGEDNVNFNCFLGPDIIKEILSETGHFKYMPYLRPMSSMTEEEKIEYYKLSDNYYDIHFYSIESVDWLNKKGFDYRGLIPIGLALEATKGMYK